MIIELKSNGTKHTVSAETWASMSRDTKRNYKVLNTTEEQVASNTVNDSAKKAPESGEKNTNELPKSKKEDDKK